MLARPISVSHSVSWYTVQNLFIYIKQPVELSKKSTITEANKRTLRKIVKTSRWSNTKKITELWRESISKKVSMFTTKRTIRKLIVA